MGSEGREMEMAFIGCRLCKISGPRNEKKGIKSRNSESCGMKSAWRPLKQVLGLPQSN